MAFTMSATKTFRTQAHHSRSRVPPQTLSAGFVGGSTRIQPRKNAPELSKWAVRAMEKLQSTNSAARRCREASRRLEKEEERKETRAQVAGSWHIPPPANMLEVFTRDELDQKVSKKGEEDVVSLIFFKAVWCKSCAGLQYAIKKAAEANPAVQFLSLDISKRSGELYHFFTENNLITIPYCLLYVNDRKVRAGRWPEIAVPRASDSSDAVKDLGCAMGPKKAFANSSTLNSSSRCTVKPKPVSSSKDSIHSSGCIVKPKVALKTSGTVNQKSECMVRPQGDRTSPDAPRSLECIVRQGGEPSSHTQENLQDVQTVGELYRKLFNHGETGTTSIVCFKSIWCREWPRLHKKIKKASRANPSVQFLLLDITDQKGEVFRYYAQNSQPILPYCLVYDGDIKVSEGRWHEVRDSILEKA